MENHIEQKNSDLFSDLSEDRQESVAGGSASGVYDLFIQKTEITTSGNSQLDALGDVNNLSSNQNSEYTMSETTIGLNLDSIFGDGPRFRSMGLNILYRLLMSLF